jgi:20S proteasome alpha/beta subunit
MIWYVSSFILSAQVEIWCRASPNFPQAPEDLFETISQALLNAVDRDALSGWGAHVYIIEKDKVTKRLLKGRQD